jgi:F-type H+-transporting ATPase subunit c
MNLQTIRLALLTLGVLLISSTPLLAGDIAGTGTFYGTAVGCGIGCALTLVGAGIGFGRIGAAALESMARQPEVAGDVGRNMITIAALLEGATFFSLIVCIILAFKS